MWGMVKLFGALREDEDSDNFSSPYFPSPYMYILWPGIRPQNCSQGTFFPLGWPLRPLYASHFNSGKIRKPDEKCLG